MNLLSYKDLPKELKRGCITDIDRKMVFKSVNTGSFHILFSNVASDVNYVAHIYYQSNVALRIMSRLLASYKFTSTQLTDGMIARHLESIPVIGWTSAFMFIVKDVDLVAAERLVFKCYRYCVKSGDQFGLFHLIKSFCLEVVKVPEVQLWPYLDKGVCWRGVSDVALFDINRVLYSEAFKPLHAHIAASWREHLTVYVSDVKPSDKILAIRDYAAGLVDENGPGHQFLVDACNEVLL